MDDNVENFRFFDSGQLSLFPIKPRYVCNRIGLNWLAAEKLYENGLLSFKPSEIEQLDFAQEAELVFLGNLVVAGCDFEMLEQLLKTLKKPYQYRDAEVYYDWSSQKWRGIPHLQESTKEEIARDWIESVDKDEILCDWIDEIELKDDKIEIKDAIIKGWIDDFLNDGDMEQLIEIEKECKWAISSLRNE